MRMGKGESAEVLTGVVRGKAGQTGESTNEDYMMRRGGR